MGADCNVRWDLPVSLSCLYKPVDNVLLNVDFFVKDVELRIFYDSPEDVTLCTFSNASSQLTSLHYQRAKVANVSLETESGNVDLPSASITKQKFHRAL